MQDEAVVRLLDSGPEKHQRRAAGEFRARRFATTKCCWKCRRSAFAAATCTCGPASKAGR